MSLSSEFLIFNKKNDFNLTLKHIVNDEFIFEILLNDCITFFTSQSQFIGIIYKDKLHVFNLDKDSDEIPEELINKLQENINSIIKLIEHSKMSGTLNSLKILKIKNDLKTNIDNMEFFINPTCIRYINLDKVHQKLKKLNNQLNTFCSNIKKNTLALNYAYDLENYSSIIYQYNTSSITTPVYATFNALLLCFFSENNCISQILLNIDMNEEQKLYLTIDSDTKTDYGRRKLNKLLRAAVIILAKELNPDLQAVVSNAVNPISLHLLAKYFKAKVYNSETNEEYKFPKENITYNDAEEYIKEYGGAIVKIELTEENIKNAETIFNELITLGDPKIKCISGGKKTKKYKKLKKYRKSIK